MTNKAILTIVNGERYDEIWKRTEPFFIRYADKCDAELIVLKSCEGYPSPHWMKFSIYDLLKKEFDRIAFIDADIIIRDDCPSLFDIVPENEFGIFNEGVYAPRAVCLHEVQKVFGIRLPTWNGNDYYNTGVMVISKRHRHIFKVTSEIKPLRNAFGEQTYLNMRIINSDVKVHSLNYKFNRMSLMDRVTGVSRLASYIVHYAGDGDRLLTKMDRDIAQWANDTPHYNYKQNVFLWSLGGLGDIVDAEPTIRYMRETTHKDANIYLMSYAHELYDHIDIHHDTKPPEGDFDAVFEYNTHQTPIDLYSHYGVAFGYHCPHGLCHPVDWVSLSVIARQLPLKDREIKLTYTDEHLKEVTDACPTPEELVLVHPGRGWPTKTFPAEWWQEVIDGLSKRYKVGIIGKEVREDRGLIDVKCPENGFDFRDKLSRKGLVALIAKAPILVSNDSAPIHIAGAFDNWIVFMPTCKHPDLLLPFRNGQVYYKAKALYKKLTEDDERPPPTEMKGWQVKNLPEGHTIEEYIPDPQTVIDEVLNINLGTPKLVINHKGEGK